MKPAPANALPRGFRFAAVNCGLRKPPNVDLGMILADEPAATAGAFTRNLVQAAPVVLCREHLSKSARGMRAIIVNTRNANCATGPAGLAAARATAQEVAQEPSLRSGASAGLLDRRHWHALAGRAHTAKPCLL